MVRAIGRGWEMGDCGGARDSEGRRATDHPSGGRVDARAGGHRGGREGIAAVFSDLSVALALALALALWRVPKGGWDEVRKGRRVGRGWGG